MSGPTKASDEQVTAALQELPGWRRVGDELHVSYQLPTFEAAVDLTVAVAAIAEELVHHPEWRVAYRRVDLLTTTHDADGLSELDFALGRRIVAAAAARGAVARTD
ncbi:MAG: 4a-hydroxytetrahydrobiopterin dehydratase [Planctomycetota bacterium]